VRQPQTSGTRMTGAILRSVIARLGRQGITFTSKGE
jgi:hypothetical protein